MLVGIVLLTTYYEVPRLRPGYSISEWCALRDVMLCKWVFQAPPPHATSDTKFE